MVRSTSVACFSGFSGVSGFPGFSGVFPTQSGANRWEMPAVMNVSTTRMRRRDIYGGMGGDHHP